MARTGIGAAYVQREMAKGRSMASIQQEAASKGYEIGAKAQAMFAGGGGGGGGGGSSSPAPAAAGPRTGIGASYVQRELDKGRSLGDIQNEARSKGYEIGSKAQAMFANAAARSNDYSGSAGVPSSGRFFDPTNYSTATDDSMGAGGFGRSALNRARAAGFTDAQIRTSLASSGVEIGGLAAQDLGVMPGKTFYTGPDGLGRPSQELADGTSRPLPESYTGQAGTRYGRPELLPYNAYNRAVNKPFEKNYLFVYGGESGGDSMSNYGDVGDKGSYSAYSEPEWSKYVGENGYNNPRPDLTGDLDDRGRALPSMDPFRSQYKQAFDSRVAAGGGMPQTAEVPRSAGVTDYMPQEKKASAVEPTSEAPAPGDVDDGPVVDPIKVDANEENYIPGQLKDNVGYLTGGGVARARQYYNSRFA